MAINIQNIIAALEAKVAAATSATETQELIVLIKTIKASGQQTIVTYATASSLPTASADNTGNIGYVADVGKLYYSNGTTWAEIGSGSSGGTAYDQSLNTTDDVIFNSALIGDVSVVGNVVGAVDAYGNKETLVVDNALTVKAEVISGGVESIGTSAGGSYNIGTMSFYEYNGFPIQYLDKLSTLTAGTVVSFVNMYSMNWGYNANGTFTVSSVNESVDYYGNRTVNVIVTNITVAGVDRTFESFNFERSNFSWSTQVSTPVDVLSADSTGVNVNGTFTVNGQPITGGSSGGTAYDQSLNTTDDVVFNSGLVGDVSIVGNTLAAVDAYGNSDTLELSVPVAFTKTETITSGSETTINYADTSMFGNSVFSPFYDYGTYQQYVKIQNDNGFNPTVALQLTSIPSGTLVRTNGLYSYGTYETKYFRFTVNSINTISDPYNPSVITQVRYSVASLEYSPDGINWYQQSFDNNNWYSSTMTSTGVLTYDDFTSETFTKSSTLTVNSDNQLKIDSNVLVEIDNSVTKTVSLSNFTSGVLFNGGDHIEIPVYGISLEDKNDLLSLKSGDIIASTNVFLPFNGQTYSAFTGTVSLAQIVDDMYGNPVVWVYGNFKVDGTSLENQRYYVFTNPLTWTIPSFTKVLETNNNQVIIPALTATDVNATDIVADSALIGDVSIIGNTISGVDAYGLTDKLVVDGDLEVTGDLTSTTDLSVVINEPIENITTIDNFAPNDWSSMDAYVLASWSETYFPELFGKKVFRINVLSYTSPLLTKLQSLSAGDQLELPGWSGTDTTRVTLAGAFLTADTGSNLLLAVELTTDSPSSGAAPNIIKLVEKSIQTANFGFNSDGSFTSGNTAKGQTSVSIKPQTFNVIDGVNTSVIRSSTDLTKDLNHVNMKIDAVPQRSISWENGSLIYSGRHESYVYGIGAGGSPAIDAYLSQYFDRITNLPITKDGTGNLSEEVVTSGGIRLMNSRSVHMEATVIARNTSGASKAWKISGVWTSHGGTPTLMANSYNSTVLGFDDHLTTGVTSGWAANIEAVSSPNPIGGVWQNLMIKVNGETDVYFSASISATIIQEIDTVESGGGGGGGK